MPAAVNIPLGSKFARLTVIGRAPSRGDGRMWRCLCDCGKTTDVLSKYLRTGNTKSCGCLVSSINGLSKLPEYHIWRLMLRRCFDERTDKYHCYGGRGITVCDRWRHSFEAFYEDMGPRPEGLTLERVDHEGNYEPDNCIWDTWKNQHRNKRSNVWLTLNGEQRLLMDWAVLLGVNKKVFYDRYKRGWADERILTTPVIKERTRDNAGRFGKAR